MIEEFPYTNEGVFDIRVERIIQKREDFLRRTLDNFFDYTAMLVKQPRELIDFDDIEYETKQIAVDSFLLQQHPGFSDEERLELRETLLHTL
jgi:regulator of sigma D